MFSWGMPLGFLLLLAAVAYHETAGTGFWSLRSFSTFVAAVVRRNLPLGAALLNYVQDMPSWGAPFRRSMLRSLSRDLDTGLSLSEALKSYPHVFPAHYRALVRAGERSGNLAPILERLAQLSEIDNYTRRRLVASTAYPALLALVTLFMALIMLPRWSWMLSEMDLPTHSSIIASGFFTPTEPALLTLLLIVMILMPLAIVLLPFLRHRTGFLGRTLGWIGEYLAWHLPLVSRFSRRRAVAQYALAAGSLMEAGLPTVEALEIAASAGGSVYLERIALESAARVAEGEPYSAALRGADPRGHLPAELLWYVQTGEHAGDLPLALARASEAAAARSESGLSSLVSLAFPAGILLAGIVVATLCLMVFEPLVRMIEMLA